MFKKILITALLLVLNAKVVFAQLDIELWKQKNVINSKGQEITIEATIRAKNLSQNTYHNSWGFMFSKNTKVELLSGSVSGQKNASISFKDNELSFNFEPLRNNDSITITFKYQQYNTIAEKTKYIRQEFVSIPQFASTGKSFLFVFIPRDYDVFSLNSRFKYSDKYGCYVWSGKVGNIGLSELFSLTLKKATWEIATRVSFDSEYNIKSLKAKIPLLYIGGNNTIVNYTVYTNQVNYIDNDKIKKDDKYIYADYQNFNSNNGFIEIRTTLKNNYNNFYWLNNFDINNMVKVDEKYEGYLSALVQSILQNDKRDLPTHVKLGEWVYKTIKYNITYVGKHMTTPEILRNKEGVCEHYSVVYRDLLRVSGIPSTIVAGVSYNTDKKIFENHAWVILFYNNDWLPMDPTWNIFSGKLPISHIFTYNSILNNFNFYDIIRTTTFGDLNSNKKSTFNITVDNTINFIE